MIYNGGGYIYKKPDFQDWVFGSNSPIPDRILNENGQWGMPTPEAQRKNGWDSYGCVSFSILNCIEAQHKALTGSEINWSDRFLVVASGTAPGYGNSGKGVADTIRAKGLVQEEVYPWVDGEEAYYADIPEHVTSLASNWFNKYAFNYEWIRFSSWASHWGELEEALRRTPLAVVVKYADGDGILNPKGGANHFVSLCGYREGEYWLIFDHYGNWFKKYDWNYSFAGVLKPHLTIKEKNMFEPKQNKKYLLVEGGTQRLFMGHEGKLMEFPTFGLCQENCNSRNRDKIIRGDLTWLVAEPITKAQFDSVKKINSKGEAIC